MNRPEGNIHSQEPTSGTYDRKMDAYISQTQLHTINKVLYIRLLILY